jgi:hypothetical protein
MLLVAVSRNGIFLGTILFKGIADETFSADCEGAVFSAETLQRIASRLKHGEVEGEMEGYEWNVQDLESMIWRPD